MIHSITANPLPCLLSSLQGLHRDLLVLKIHKDGIVGSTGPAETNQVLAGQRWVMVAFPMKQTLIKCLRRLGFHAIAPTGFFGYNI